MHCTSYIPVYSQPRRCNALETGISWHSSNYDANLVQEMENGVFFPSFCMNQHLDSDKEALKKIMQKHEATFRYQLEELHRLYRRQRELMDVISMSPIFTQSLQSGKTELNGYSAQAHSGMYQTSQTSNWILGNSPDKLSMSTAEIGRPIFVLKSLTNSTMALSSPLATENSCGEVEALSSRNERHAVRSWDLQRPASVEEEKQFEGINGSKYLAKESELAPVKTGNLPGISRESGNKIFFIDLNLPAQPDPFPSSSTGSSEFMHNDSHFSGVDKRTSLMGIDLNSRPLNCLPEAAATLDGLVDTAEEFKVQHTREFSCPLSGKQEYDDDYDDSRFSCSCNIEIPNASDLDDTVYDGASSKGKCAGEGPVLGTNIKGNLSKIKSEVDLNIKVIGESLPSAWDKSTPEIDLEAPTSPENKEGSPPRGESEDIGIEKSPLSTQQRKSELESELAAETLVLISSSKARNLDSGNCLYWFANIVSSTEKPHEDHGELRIDGHDFCNKLKGWGMRKKRQPGARRRSSKFPLIC